MDVSQHASLLPVIIQPDQILIQIESRSLGDLFFVRKGELNERASCRKATRVYTSKDKSPTDMTIRPDFKTFNFPILPSFCVDT